MTEIRTMTHEDIETGLELCRFAGWNQIRSHWEVLLALAPDGVFVTEVDGQVRATASAVNHGARTGWIGMILVHPDFRGRGIATSLMSRCIAHLRGKGVQSIKLDATDLGRPVYLKLGFKDERTICRYVGNRRGEAFQGNASPLPASASDVRPIASADWPIVARTDRAAFDADRTALLKLLHAQGHSAVVAAGPTIQAYGFARRGFHASSIGPVVAADPESARGLIVHLLDKLPEGEVYWDFMPDNAPCRELAESLGFTVARKLMRMYLGGVNPGRLSMLYAGAGFELG